MQRRPSTQDITWLLDLNQNKQLDLDPPYQRRSVWTRKDKQFFLDTIFRNYPSPSIFLHKTVDDAGKATYHVVDGKQRTQTILDFVQDRVAIANDFGDTRLSGKKWTDLRETELKQTFWNYQITVEMLDIVEGTIVNEVFDRLNRNARKLTPQELRHSKFDGWLITQVEAESEREEWRELGVTTAARAKRMTDSQFISELMLIILEKRVLGFDQDLLDELYAKYDVPLETAPDFNEDDFQRSLGESKKYLLGMQRAEDNVRRYIKGFGNLYSLWSLIAMVDVRSISPSDMAQRYVTFMKEVDRLGEPGILLQTEPRDRNRAVYLYWLSSRGASTDLSPRMNRLEAMVATLVTDPR